MKKRNKVISQLDININLLLKENRVGTKTYKSLNVLSDDDIYNNIIEKIIQFDTCVEQDITEIFIIDKCYTYDELNFLYNDTNYIFIINNDIIYNKLINTDINITNIDLYFFDDLNKLKRFTRGS